MDEHTGNVQELHLASKLAKCQISKYCFNTAARLIEAIFNNH